MRISILGTGYVGLVTGACLAELGHSVVCIDSDAGKIARLQAGHCPIFEPGLAEMIARNAPARLVFMQEAEAGVKRAEIVFIAVGTPASEIDGQPDLSQLRAAVAAAARAMKDGALMVIKSTVPVGTVRALAAHVREFRPQAGLVLASNPEFLRQGSAIEDFMRPDRIIIGVDSPRAHGLLAELYAPLTREGAPLLATTFESAEMIKYAANTMLAAKIAFINEIADICEKVGANIRDVAKGVGLDARIGAQFLQAGPGFGGSCFPKDTMALQGIAHARALATPLVDAVVTSNLSRKHRMLEKIIAACGGRMAGKTVAVLGLTFKPGTDDLRESIALTIIPGLLAAGASIRAYDPQGMEHARRIFSGDIAWCASAEDASTGADACVLLTEWNEFKSLDLPRIAALMRTPLMVDLRNLYKRRAMAAAGFRYLSVGRAEVSPDHPEAMDLLPEAEALEAHASC